MTNPIRVQLRRTKGWRMPPNTVSVARPTKYGNPFRVGVCDNLGRGPLDNAGAVAMFEDMLNDPELLAAYEYPADLSPLRGKNLACFCPITDSAGYCECHADVLLSLANDIPMGEVRRENLKRSKGEAL